jgi:hypothetical protein
LGQLISDRSGLAQPAAELVVKLGLVAEAELEDPIVAVDIDLVEARRLDLPLQPEAEPDPVASTRTPAKRARVMSGRPTKCASSGTTTQECHMLRVTYDLPQRGHVQSGRRAISRRW